MLLAILLVLSGVAVTVYTFQQDNQAQDKADQNQTTSKRKAKPPPVAGSTMSIQAEKPQTLADTIVSTSLTSPDGSYIVEEIPQRGDGFGFTIKDRSGKIIANDIPTPEDEKAMGFGTKILPQYGLHFGGWTSNSRFAWKINNAEDHEYQYIVDAATGKADIATYKQIR